MGIWWDATNVDIIERVNSLKWLKPNRLGYVMLVHPNHIGNYVDCDLDKIIWKYQELQCPVTFRFENPRWIPDLMLLQSEGTIVFRIPFSCEYLMEVLELFGKPIISTSANITNSPYPLSFDEIVEEIKNGVDYIVPKHLDSGTQKPSTIVSYKDDIIFRS
jgi:L-threonylcarbamoyladenylate synthase